jgi:hypothetical protein
VASNPHGKDTDTRCTPHPRRSSWPRSTSAAGSPTPGVPWLAGCAGGRAGTTAAAAPATEPPATEQQPAVAQAAAATPPTLSPMLLVAGLVTGIAVLCLLLLSSRRA